MGRLADGKHVLLSASQRLFETVVSSITDFFEFAYKKPLQLITLVLGGFLIIAGWWGISTTQELVKTQQIVKERSVYITQQTKTITKYRTILKVEKEKCTSSIQHTNQMVAQMKKFSDKAIALAQAKAKEAEKKKAVYQQLATKYSKSNTSNAKPEVRIEQEEKTTDDFIQDLKETK